MAQSIDAAIFDMDGLLIDSEPLWDEAKIRVFRGLGIELSAEMCAETKGFRQADMVRYWYDRHPWTGPTLSEVAHEIVTALCARIEEGVQPLPGVPQALADLASRGLPLAVASSSPARVIRAVLSSRDFAARFRVVRSADAELKGKPAPDVYLSAARELGVHPHRCLAFEDSPTGVLSALAAGMRVVAVPSATDCHLPVFDSAWLKLDSLNELSSLTRALGWTEPFDDGTDR